MVCTPCQPEQRTLNCLHPSKPRVHVSPCHLALFSGSHAPGTSRRHRDIPGVWQQRVLGGDDGGGGRGRHLHGHHGRDPASPRRSARVSHKELVAHDALYRIAVYVDVVCDVAEANAMSAIGLKPVRFVVRPAPDLSSAWPSSACFRVHMHQLQFFFFSPCSTCQLDPSVFFECLQEDGLAPSARAAAWRRRTARRSMSPRTWPPPPRPPPLPPRARRTAR